MSTWGGVDSLTLMVCGSAPPPPPGQKTRLFCDAIFVLKIHRFTKTGSGQTYLVGKGALKKGVMRFLAGPPLSCADKCQAAGHCAVGLVSCGQAPSCGQGCEVAAAGASLEECKAVCKTAGGNGDGSAGCTHKYKNLTLQSCAGCATWQPGQKKPAGLSPYANCGQNSIGHCIEGCEYPLRTSDRSESLTAVFSFKIEPFFLHSLRTES